ncbi:serine/threonine protein kinase [Minicystis rosea]|nr:serine/threonine protein kinase [Minicystis rosea]
MSANEPLAGGQAKEAAQARAATLVGKTLRDRYRIEEIVAMGGLATVFRATKLKGGQEVAIKILHPEIEGLPELIERFEREAIAGKHILHPNVVAVHEIDQIDDGSWFLVQDYVRGRTLRDLIDEGPVEARRAARIARQVAAGLVAAHDMGIVHRDIKPLNLMIGHEPDDLVQIVDFGLAKVPVDDLSVLDGEGRRSLTQAGVVFGTLAYMAPEAALGMRNIDRRSDLYAVGVVLYELLAGRHPFTATAPAALFAQQRNEIPPPIGQRSPGVTVPPALEAVVHRLLEKDPDQRYPNGRALMVALDAALREMEAPATLATKSVPAAAASLSRGRLAALALVAVAVLGAVIWAVVSRH